MLIPSYLTSTYSTGLQEGYMQLEQSKISALNIYITNCTCSKDATMTP